MSEETKAGELVVKKRRGGLRPGAGRKKGQTDSALAEMRRPLADILPAAIEVVRNAVEAGDVAVAAGVIARIVPAARPEAAPIVLRCGEHAPSDVMLQSALEDVASGRMSVSAAVDLAKLIEITKQAQEVADIKARLDALDAQS